MGPPTVRVKRTKNLQAVGLDNEGEILQNCHTAALGLEINTTVFSCDGTPDCPGGADEAVCRQSLETVLETITPYEHVY